MIWPFRIKHPAALVEAHDTIDRLTKDVTYWQGRALTAGRLSSEVIRERDALQARLDALTPARIEQPLSERDRNLLRAIGDGGRTFQIANFMGWDTPMTRRCLYRMERAGLIQRDAKHSAVNDVRWLPTPPETTA